jgi:hypothetical protein
MQGQADLPQIVLARRAARGFASRLHGGKQQRDQDADDGNDHEEFDKRESTVGSRRQTAGGVLEFEIRNLRLEIKPCSFGCLFGLSVDRGAGLTPICAR